MQWLTAMNPEGRFLIASGVLSTKALHSIFNETFILLLSRVLPLELNSQVFYVIFSHKYGNKQLKRLCLNI